MEWIVTSATPDACAGLSIHKHLQPQKGGHQNGQMEFIITWVGDTSWLPLLESKH